MELWRPIMANASLRAAAPASTLTPVEFHGATLSVILINGVPHVALKPICEAIGLAWQGQIERIKRHPVLSTCVSLTRMQMPGDDQAREVFMLPLDKLNGWLFGVSVRRVRPELRERLTRYQAECFDVLARHFGAAAPHQDSSFADPVNIHALPAPARNRSPDHWGNPLPLPRVILEPARSLLDAAVWRMTGQAHDQIADWAARRLANSCRVDVADDLQHRAEGALNALQLDDFLTCSEASRAAVLLNLVDAMAATAAEQAQRLRKTLAGLSPQAGQGALVNLSNRDS
jgi:hypothetical protein